ncbi:hypothetical protein EV363DRAFT_1392423 [Boletus edulis]|nr:hypothetical protein EV363DRAFT_1392423 [Boletus edulis]
MVLCTFTPSKPTASTTLFAAFAYVATTPWISTSTYGGEGGSCSRGKMYINGSIYRTILQDV